MSRQAVVSPREICYSGHIKYVNEIAFFFKYEFLIILTKSYVSFPKRNIHTKKTSKESKSLVNENEVFVTLE